MITLTPPPPPPKATSDGGFSDPVWQRWFSQLFKTVQSAITGYAYSKDNPVGYITAAGAPVQSVAGRAGAVVLVKADVGLGTVDNTSDSAKPVSTAQSSALSLKANVAGLRVTEGSNSKQGVFTLVSGISIVGNTSVTSVSRIFLTSQVDGGTPGFLRVSSRVVGTSFTVTSGNPLDTSVVAFEILEPG